MGYALSETEALNTETMGCDRVESRKVQQAKAAQLEILSQRSRTLANFTFYIAHCSRNALKKAPMK
jgi:hypothetical protein